MNPYSKYQAPNIRILNISRTLRSSDQTSALYTSVERRKLLTKHPHYTHQSNIEGHRPDTVPWPSIEHQKLLTKHPRYKYESHTESFRPHFLTIYISLKATITHPSNLSILQPKTSSPIAVMPWSCCKCSTQNSEAVVWCGGCGHYTVNCIECFTYCRCVLEYGLSQVGWGWRRELIRGLHGRKLWDEFPRRILLVFFVCCGGFRDIVAYRLSSNLIIANNQG